MIEIKNAKAIFIPSEQYEAIVTVEEIMRELMTLYPEETVDYLINPTTGELIETREFARIRGILSFIREQPFEVEMK